MGVIGREDCERDAVGKALLGSVKYVDRGVEIYASISGRRGAPSLAIPQPANISSGGEGKPPGVPGRWMFGVAASASLRAAQNVTDEASREIARGAGSEIRFLITMARDARPPRKLRAWPPLAWRGKEKKSLIGINCLNLPSIIMPIEAPAPAAEFSAVGAIWPRRIALACL